MNKIILYNMGISISESERSNPSYKKKDNIRQKTPTLRIQEIDTGDDLKENGATIDLYKFER